MQLDTVAAGVTTFNHTGLQPGRRYRYRIVAHNDGDAIGTPYIDGVRLPRPNEAFPGNDVPDAPASRHILDLYEYDEEEYRFPYDTEYHVNMFQRRPGNEGNSYFIDLRGGKIDGIHVGPGGQSIDSATFEFTDNGSNFFDVNINDPNTYAADPFLQNPANRVVPAGFVPLVNIDHTTGIGGGPRDLDTPDSTSNRSIHRHPVVHNWLTYHINNINWSVT